MDMRRTRTRTSTRFGILVQRGFDDGGPRWLFLQIRRDDVRACGGVGLGDGAAEPAAAAGDEGDFVVQRGDVADG